MGFGLLLIGYISVLGVYPNINIYTYVWAALIGIAGAIIAYFGACKLAEFGLFFRVFKVMTMAYIALVAILGTSDVLGINDPESGAFAIFEGISLAVRILFLFAYHFILATAIKNLAREVGNGKTERAAKRVLFASYVYFPLTLLPMFISVSQELLIVEITAGLIYFGLNIVMLYSSFVRITFEGHDEAVEAKHKKKSSSE
ncbi:hypothetical protein FACS1894105_02420 [Clostridia bacterium]|nr:hypothetical protein FACS1894105_02290 [Clostridia bacterium]GHU34856.1 hypothetical protein FACS1894105_02420 [Clostridia bacterium]